MKKLIVRWFTVAASVCICCKSDQSTAVNKICLYFPLRGIPSLNDSRSNFLLEFQNAKASSEEVPDNSFRLFWHSANISFVIQRPSVVLVLSIFCFTLAKVCLSMRTLLNDNGKRVLSE